MVNQSTVIAFVLGVVAFWAYMRFVAKKGAAG
jgi:hypothetical protein